MRGLYRPGLVNGISTTFNGTVVDSLSYTYDALSRPTSRNSDVFAYNDRSEVISAQIGTNLFAHAYDSIGNQTNHVANAATNSYAHNALNQMVGRGVPAAPQTVKFQWNHLPAVSRRSGATFSTPFRSSMPTTLTFPPG